jgi:hypothetical protein
MIDAIAITSGSTARKDAKTKASTTSAPSPPSTASSRTPGPWPPPRCADSASSPVRRTGPPATVASPSAARAARSASGLDPKSDSAPGREHTSANVVRRSADTNASSFVEANDAMRAPGSARRKRASMARRSARTPGSSAVWPRGSATTGTSGGLWPPVPP